MKSHSSHYRRSLPPDLARFRSVPDLIEPSRFKLGGTSPTPRLMSFSAMNSLRKFYFVRTKG